MSQIFSFWWYTKVLCIRRSIHTNLPLLCKATGGEGKPAATPPLTRRRSKLSPEDRINDMQGNLTREKETQSDDNMTTSSPLPKEKGHFKKQMSWRLSRRRSLSPMARVQDMMDGQEDKDSKDSDKDN